MADDIDEQVTAHIREILHLVLDVKGKTLRKLNERAMLNRLKSGADLKRVFGIENNSEGGK